MPRLDHVPSTNWRPSEMRSCWGSSSYAPSLPRRVGQNDPLPWLHDRYVDRGLMAIELNHAGGGVAAYLLSLNTLLVLGKNGTLAHNEVAEVVDRSLMQLETVDQEPRLQSEEAARLARALLEQARARLGRNQAG